MFCPTILCATTAALSLVLAASANAQSGEIKATFPFGASQAVADDPDLDLVFAGLGSGIMLLDGSSDQPALYDPGVPGTLENRLRPEGFVREMATTPDHLYVAAGRAGLVRYDRGDNYTPNWSYLSDLQLSANDPEVWALSVDRIGGFDFIVLGTHDHGDIGCSGVDCADDGTGTLFLLRLNPAFPNEQPTIRDTVNLGAPIYAIESMLVNDKLTVLVGTACAENDLGQPAGLFRYDWDVSSSLPQVFDTTPVTWAVGDDVGAGVPTLVKDIAIDPDPTAPAAYVAAFTRGLHKLELLSGGGFGTTSGTQFPIASADAIFHGVAVPKDIDPPVVVAALGPAFHKDRQVWGCSHVLACDDPVVGAAANALLEVHLYDASTGAPLAQLGKASDDCTGPICDTLLPSDAQPMKVAVRKDDAVSGRLRIDLAADGSGVLVIAAELNGSQYRLGRVGNWGKEIQGLPTGSLDDLLLIENTLYVAVETGITSFRTDLDPAVPAELALLLDTQEVAHVSGAGVLIDGCVAPDSIGSHLIYGRHSNGVAVYNASVDASGVSTQISQEGQITSGGENRRGYGVHVMPPSDTPQADGMPWIVVAASADSEVTGSCGPREKHGSIRVFRARDVDGPGGLPDGKWTASEVEPLGAWLPTICPDTAEADGFLVDCHVLPTTLPGYGTGNLICTDTYAVLVSYGKRDDELDAGLLVLRMVYCTDSVHPDGFVDISFERKVPAFTGLCEETEEEVGLLAPLGGGKLGVALGCQGVAIYDVSNPLHPTLDGTWSEGVTCGDEGFTALQIAPAPGDHAYVAFLDMDVGGVGLLDYGSAPVVSLESLWHSPFNANAMVTAPSSLPGNEPALFVADGRGGLHYVQFDQSP